MYVPRSDVQERDKGEGGGRSLGLMSGEGWVVGL